MSRLPALYVTAQPVVFLAVLIAVVLSIVFIPHKRVAAFPAPVFKHFANGHVHIIEKGVFMLAQYIQHDCGGFRVGFQQAFNPVGIYPDNYFIFFIVLTPVVICD